MTQEAVAEKFQKEFDDLMSVSDVENYSICCMKWIDEEKTKN